MNTMGNSWVHSYPTTTLPHHHLLSAISRGNDIHLWVDFEVKPTKKKNNRRKREKKALRDVVVVIGFNTT